MLSVLDAVLLYRERKTNMVLELVPVQDKYISQIGILEEFATGLVIFLVPATTLTSLIKLVAIHQDAFLHLPYYNTRKKSI